MSNSHYSHDPAHLKVLPESGPTRIYLSDMPNVDPDLLITRIIDGRDSGLDWDAFEAFATAQPTLYRDLARAQRDHRHLVAQVLQETAIAGRVSAPVHILRRSDSSGSATSKAPVAHAADQSNSVHSYPLDPPRRSERSRRLGAWAGWAVAATIVLASLSRLGVKSSSSELTDSIGQPNIVAGFPQGTIPGSNAAGDPTASLTAYLDQGRRAGRVVAEQPMRLLGVEQLPDGAGYRVVYERPIVESAIVSRPYSLEPGDLINSASLRLMPIEPVRRPREPELR